MQNGEEDGLSDITPDEDDLATEELLRMWEEGQPVEIVRNVSVDDSPWVRGKSSTESTAKRALLSEIQNWGFFGIESYLVPSTPRERGGNSDTAAQLAG
ncbi:MAG: hypothetical protein JWN15_767 [Firmicutes bacterium]|nr:hypothetical protein [Bacillota bacterium]